MIATLVVRPELRWTSLAAGLVVCLWLSPAWSTTFYIAPNGNDSNPCTSTQRCATVRGVTALPSFGAGDSVIVGDGTYSNRPVEITCDAKLQGTAAAPIRVIGENERRAHFTTTNGSSALVLRNCNYWAIEKLHFSQRDFATDKGENLAEIIDSDHFTFRTNLVSRNNHRNTDPSGGVLLNRSADWVFEDNEFHNFRRHAVAAKYENRGVFRRNYCNAGLGGAITTGRCLSIYPGSDILVEDNTVENGDYMFSSVAFNENNRNNRWFGNIGLNLRGGLILLLPRCDGSRDGATIDAIVKNNLNVGGSGRLLWSRSSQVVASHNSAFGGTSRASFLADQPSCAPVDNAFEVTDSLVIGTRAEAFYAAPAVAADKVVFINNAVFDNSSNFVPASKATGSIMVDPGFGTAHVCAPTSSPLQGAASDGSDVGANVLYTRTGLPRWTLTRPPSCPKNVSGIYPDGMGACLAGINDDPSKGLVGIADRLRITRKQIEEDCGEITYFNTTAKPPSAAVCGQNGCESGETCESCPQDCGACAAPKATMAVNAQGFNVDGRLDDCGWSDAAWESFGDTTRSDNTVEFATAWDPTHLYVGFKVTDAQLESDASGIWQNDGVEIFLDALHNATSATDADDFHVIADIASNSTHSSVQVGFTPTSTGYGMELGIPWSTLGLSPATSKTLGILVGNNDRDMGSSAQFDWNGIGASGPYARPNLWGDVLLGTAVREACGEDLSVPPSPSPTTCAEVTACIDNDGCCPEDCIGSDLDCSLTGTVNCTDDGRGGKICSVNDVVGCNATGDTLPWGLVLISAGLGGSILGRRRKLRK